MQDGEAQIGRFASTGGWTWTKRPRAMPALRLLPTSDQQALLQEVVMAVYRP
jgi:hypothetical protein